MVVDKELFFEDRRPIRPDLKDTDNKINSAFLDKALSMSESAKAVAEKILTIERNLSQRVKSSGTLTEAHQETLLHLEVSMANLILYTNSAYLNLKFLCQRPYESAIEAAAIVAQLQNYCVDFEKYLDLEKT